MAFEAKQEARGQAEPAQVQAARGQVEQAVPGQEQGLGRRVRGVQSISRGGLRVPQPSRPRESVKHLVWEWAATPLEGRTASVWEPMRSG